LFSNKAPELSFSEVVREAPEFICAATPNPEASQVICTWVEYLGMWAVSLVIRVGVVYPGIWLIYPGIIHMDGICR